MFWKHFLSQNLIVPLKFQLRDVKLTYMYISFVVRVTGNTFLLLGCSGHLASLQLMSGGGSRCLEDSIFLFYLFYSSKKWRVAYKASVFTLPTCQELPPLSEHRLDLLGGRGLGRNPPNTAGMWACTELRVSIPDKGKYRRLLRGSEGVKGGVRAESDVDFGELLLIPRDRLPS